MAPGDQSGGFGDILRRYRLAAGLSQAELAERAGLSYRGISDLERGQRRSPHPATVRRLAEALGLDAVDRSELHGAVKITGRAVHDPLAAVEQRFQHNLPVQLTSFIGREQQIADIRRELSQHRLLTLTGPGGVGKTRLALEVASDMQHAYSHGRWLIDFAPLQDAGLIPHTVAKTVGLREPVDPDPVLSLVEALGDQEMLLVFDNCEHLVVACAALVETLLRRCSGVHILATSRIVLGVSGEVNWRVTPLDLPSGALPATVDAVTRSEASRLFVERARAARPGFVVDPSNAPGISSICRSVDGIPLAIELAAARMGVLGVDQIAARLDNALDLLAEGPRMAAARHHALRATLDWSYRLLADRERRLFERTSVFAGGWTLEAAESVCAADGADPHDVLDGLGHLVDQSLVLAEPADGGAMRFRLLEPLRQYAMEQLELTGGTNEVRRRHAAYYTRLVESVGGQWTGRDLARLAVLEAEHDNARAALRWMIEAGKAEQALQLSSAAAYLWQQRGRASEGRRWLSEALALPAKGSSLARTRALIYASTLIAEQGEYAPARPLIEAAVNMARALGDAPTLAFALYRLAQVTWFRREFAAARDQANEGASIARAIGNANLEGINLWQVAQASHDLAHPDAETLAEEAVAIFSEVQNATMLGCALTTLAQVHLGRGDLAGARQLMDRAVAAHPVEFRGVAQMFSNVNLGWVATMQGDLTTAHTALLSALRMARDVLGAQARLVTPLEGLAQLASAGGQPVRALRLAGAASRLRRQFTTPPTPTELRLLQGWMSHARAQLTREDADAAWASGEQLTSQQAIAEALALELGPAPRRPVDGLTRRERQVAMLVAGGAGTQEIAEQLVISRNTARVHVEHILSKLGLHSRAQLAIWVTQRNIAPDSLDGSQSFDRSGEFESLTTH